MQTKDMDADAFRRAIRSTENPDHRETSMAIHILVESAAVGADVSRLSDWTGYDVSEIQKFENNLRAARLWIGELVDDREWSIEEDEDQMMFVLYVHAQVARGRLQRRLEHNVAIYLDLEGLEQARIPIPDGSTFA